MQYIARFKINVDLDFAATVIEFESGETPIFKLPTITFFQLYFPFATNKSIHGNIYVTLQSISIIVAGFLKNENKIRAYLSM